MKINNVQSYNICNNDRNKTSFKGYVHPDLFDGFYKNSLSQIRVDSPLIEEGVQRILKGEYSTFKEFLNGARDSIINTIFKPVFNMMEELPENICLNKVNTRVNEYNFERLNVFALYKDEIDINKIADRAPNSTRNPVMYSFAHHENDEILNSYGRHGYILNPDIYTAEQLEHWIKKYGWPGLQRQFRR